MSIFQRATSAWARQSTFLRHVLTVFSGTALSQMFPFLAAPLLTRLFSQYEFGVFSSFLSVSTILVVIATGRYELAIVIPRSQRKSNAVFVGTFYLASVMSVVILLGSIIYISQIPVVNVGDYWPLCLAPMVWLLALNAILANWLNRQRRFGMMASQQIGLKCTAESGKIGLGLMGMTGLGMVWGGILGQLAAVVMVLRKDSETLRQKIAVAKHGVSLRLLKAYWKLPVFTASYSFSATIANEFLVLLYASGGQMKIAGLIGLTRRLLVAPVTFVGSAIGGVYFRESCEHIHTPEHERLTLSIIWRIGLLAAPAFSFLLFWGADIFSFVFGETWAQAGTFASLLTLPCYLFLFTSWPERLYEITGKQHLSFGIQLITDMIKILLTYLVLHRGGSPEDCVLVFSLSWSAFHVLYLLGLMRVAKFSLAASGMMWLAIVVPAVISAGWMYLADSLHVASVASPLIGLCALAVLYLMICLFCGKSILRLNK